MSYCTQTLGVTGDMAPALISLAQLDALSNDDEAGIDPQDAIDQAISAADSEIDSYCGVKYSVPFGTAPERIKNLSADIAAYRLFKKRSSAVGMPETIRDAYEDAIAFLKDVSKGIASLGIDPPPTNNSVINAKVKTNDRMFTRTSLNDF